MKTFPMFLRMQGREVIVIGSGEQAAQKARLILKTEARLTLVAPDLEPELQAIVAAGRASHHADPATPERLAQAILVFCATGDAAMDAAHAAMARDVGVLVNAVDQPDLCEAYTPSLVDRDPVVVAIGTEGTAPVLARQIKTQIEGLLEPTLGGFAALAGRMREAVAQAVPAERRRAFWRWAFEGPRRAHARGAERDAAGALKAAVAEGRAPGNDDLPAISLVGAGPGAADLLTLRAVRRLQEADVIFYDALVDPGVLELARRDAERICVGNAPRAQPWPQDRVDRTVVAAALQGKRVVRLKGDDPSVFARAEEEAEEEIAAARAAGLEVETIPGVTAASAAAAALGRPLTQRGATGRLVPANAVAAQGDGARPEQEFHPRPTLALWTDIAAAAEIQARLLAYGISGSCATEAPPAPPPAISAAD